MVALGAVSSCESYTYVLHKPSFDFCLTLYYLIGVVEFMKENRSLDVPCRAAATSQRSQAVLLVSLTVFSSRARAQISSCYS